MPVKTWDELSTPEGYEKYYGKPKGAKMRTNDLIKLAELLDTNGEHAAADEVDKMIANMSQENEPETAEILVEPVIEQDPTLSSLNTVFEKLADVADSLDSEGACSEANMIDDFIQKYAVDPEESSFIEHRDLANKLFDVVMKWQEEQKLHPAESDKHVLAALNRVADFVKHQTPQKEQESGLGPAVEQEMGGVSEELQKLESSRINQELSKVADPILPDVADWKEEADTERSKRYDSKHHHNLQVREPKRDQERVDREGRKEHHISTYKASATSGLSTRYCPDHVGVQMGRVGESIYQCPLDGKAYNWDTGYTDYEGNQVPGGSVAAQTPDSSGYGIPHRIFDTREVTINEVN